MKTVTRKQLNKMSASQIKCVLAKTPISITRYRDLVGSISLEPLITPEETMSFSEFGRLSRNDLPENAALICGYGEGKETMIYWRKSNV